MFFFLLLSPEYVFADECKSLQTKCQNERKTKNELYTIPLWVSLLCGKVAERKS